MEGMPTKAGLRAAAAYWEEVCLLSGGRNDDLMIRIWISQNENTKSYKISICQDAGHDQATIRVAAPLTGPRDFYGSMAQTAPEVQRNMIGQGDVETDGVRWFEVQKFKWVVKWSSS
jgi:hypothetical protein